MKKKILIIIISILAILAFDHIHAYTFFEKYGSRMKIEGKTFIGPELEQSSVGMYHLYNAEATATFASVEYGYTTEKYDVYMRENIYVLAESASDDSALGLWYNTARLYEITEEIRYRLRRGDNDEQDLEFYKKLLAKTVKVDGNNHTEWTCPDDYPHKDSDPLYYLGCYNTSGANLSTRYRINVSLWNSGGFGDWQVMVDGDTDIIPAYKYTMETLPQEYYDDLIPYSLYNDGWIETAYWHVKEIFKSADGVLDDVIAKLYELSNPSETPDVGTDADADAEGSDGTQTVTRPSVEETNPKGWWGAAQDFFENAKNSGASAAADDLINELTDMIFDIGNMIFIIVTSILGVKYIFGSAEGKAQIKDGLITLIVAALFFYGWVSINNLLNFGGKILDDGTVDISTGLLTDTGNTFDAAAAKIYNTVLFIINLAAICGVIWIGVKYMLSSAEGKAEIKTSWGPLILGIVMVYATVWFLSTIIQVIL